MKPKYKNNLMVFGNLIACLSLGALYIMPFFKEEETFAEEYIEQLPEFTVETGDDENFWYTPPLLPNQIFNAPLINWTKIFLVLRNHALWRLEVKHPVTGDWIDATYLLNITRNYTSNNTCKIGLEFTTPDNGLHLDWRFTLGIDWQVRQHINNTGNHSYMLQYISNDTGLSFNISFNWSDAISIPGIRFNHGVHEIGGIDVFWFRIMRDAVPPNYHVLIDPTYSVYSGSVIGKIGAYNGGRNLCRQSNGTLWCCFFENSDVHVAWSTDEGQNWHDTEVYGAHRSDCPDIAVDSNDTVHLFWYGYHAGSTADLQIRYSNNADGKWGDITNITSGTTNVDHKTRPSIGIDMMDRLHLSFEDYLEGTSNDTQIAYIRSTDNGATWSARVLLIDEANNADDLFNPKTVIGIADLGNSKNRIHIFAAQEDGPDRIFHLWSNDSGITWNGWPLPGNSPTDIVVQPGFDCRFPDAAVADNGTIYLTYWREGVDGVYTAWGTLKNWHDGGLAYNNGISAYRMFSTTSVSEDGHVHLAMGNKTQYSSPSDIMYMKDSGSGWSTPLNLSNHGDDAHPNMIHAVYPLDGDAMTNRPATGTAMVYNSNTDTIYYRAYQLTWDTDTSGAKEWQNTESGYLTGGNVSLDWTNMESGYLTGGNLSVDWINTESGYLNGGNVSLDWFNTESGYLTGGNVSLDWFNIELGWLTGGNLSIDLIWINIESGYLTGGNASLNWVNTESGYLTGGNVSDYPSVSNPNPSNISVDIPLNTSTSVLINYTYFPSSIKRYEYYSGALNMWLYFGNTYWLSQNFTVGTVGDNEDFYPNSIKLALAKDEIHEQGDITVGIRETLTGVDLCNGTTNGTSLPDDASATVYEYRNITMTPSVKLSAGTNYSIIVRASDANSSSALRLCGDHTGTYAGGLLYTSNDEGASWADHPDDDVRFYIWGHGESLNYTFHTNESGTWSEYGNGTISANGTVYANNSFTSYDTTYYWSVNVTDGTLWTNETYSFTTIYRTWQNTESGYLTGGNVTTIWNNIESGWLTGGNVSLDWFLTETGWITGGNVTIDWINTQSGWLTGGNVSQSPTFLDEDPTNGSIVRGITTYDWSINITDVVKFNWTINCSNGQNSSNFSVTNGTFYLNLTGLSATNTYTVWVNATNWNESRHEIYIFTVMPPLTPGGGAGGGFYVSPIVEEEEIPEVTEKGFDVFTTGLCILGALSAFIIFLILYKRRKKKKR